MMGTKKIEAFEPTSLIIYFTTNNILSQFKKSIVWKQQVYLLKPRICIYDPLILLKHCFA